MGAIVDFIIGCAVVAFFIIGIAGGPCCWVAIRTVYGRMGVKGRPLRTILTVMFAIILFVVTSPNYVSGASAIEVK